MKPQERVPPHPPQIRAHFLTKQNSQTELEQVADEEGQRGSRRASVQRLSRGKSETEGEDQQPTK